MIVLFCVFVLIQVVTVWYIRRINSQLQSNCDAISQTLADCRTRIEKLEAKMHSLQSSQDDLASSFREIEDVMRLMPLPPCDRQITEHNNLTLKEHKDDILNCHTIVMASRNEVLRRYDYRLWWFRQVRLYEEYKYEACKDENGMPVTKTEDVEVDKIVGTDHESHSKGNWLDMLLNLPRNKSNVNIGNWKRCITEGVDTTWGNKLTAIEYYKIVDTGEYYIRNGNHRTCHAKFIGLSHVLATVHYMRVKKMDSQMP